MLISNYQPNTTLKYSALHVSFSYAVSFTWDSLPFFFCLSAFLKPGAGIESNLSDEFTHLFQRISWLACASLSLINMPTIRLVEQFNKYKISLGWPTTKTPLKSPALPKAETAKQKIVIIS